MAQIDVTDIVVDPDFVDPVTHIYRKPVINNLGENTLQEVRTETIGSIQPASGKVINRLPESLRVADVSSFWLKGEIVVSGQDKYPDILEFKGKRYQVQTVQDWTNWGAGWCEGTCVVERPS